MPGELQFSAHGLSDAKRIAEVRLRCYGAKAGSLDEFEKWTTEDTRTGNGDVLIATTDDQDVGTATSYSFNMWVRGNPVPCQGVAWVGTVKTMRRRGSSGGVASALMQQLLKLARDREQVVSALMPFRASFYERFGYGIAERRSVWIIPMSLLPSGHPGNFRYAAEEDIPALAKLSHRIAEEGRCDIERTIDGWHAQKAAWEDGFMLVDGAPASGRIDSYLLLMDLKEPGRTIANIADRGARSIAAIRQQLHFLRTLSDQYSAVRITVPAGLPLNRLLREMQLPHRKVEHPFSVLESQTRMQIRVLDHRRFVESMRFPDSIRARATISVRETEGHESRFDLDISAGQCACKPSTATPAVTLPDRTWASIVSGELAATSAAAMGLIDVADASALPVLSALSDGPAPFSHEYF